MLGFEFISESWVFISLGFGLGLLHALDADHVMAVSSLSNTRPGWRRSLMFSANWALGHGGVLLFSGICLFGLGMAIPQSLQHVAEASVGVLLIVLGMNFFWHIHREKLKISKHSHGEIEHIHWMEEKHATSSTCENDKQSDEPITRADKHKPVMVGVLHGLAGSAPALALIPAVVQGNVVVALLYLFLFSAGVMLSMLAFGLGFASIQSYISHKSQKIFFVLRHIIATASIVLGGYWLLQAA